MGLLNTSLQIGKSAIMANSLAMDVVGNNIANASTEGYVRQAVGLKSVDGVRTQQGPYLSLGVKADEIRRLSDIYLEQRLRDARSDTESAMAQDQIFQRLEGIFNELTDEDLSTAMNEFFNALNTLQGSPEDRSVRRTVIESALTFTESVRRLRERMDTLRSDIDSEVAVAAENINAITAEIASLNGEIVTLEAGSAHSGGGNALRDRRDALLGQLADLIEVRVIEQESGAVNVFAGSDPLVMLNRSYDVAIETRVDRGTALSDIVFAADGRPVELRAGRLEGLVTARDETIPAFSDELDTWAAGFIEGFNKIHSSGQGLDLYQEITGTNGVDDAALVLSGAGLDFTPVTGTFDLNVTNATSGEAVTLRIHVDLDGIGGNDTTLTSLVAQINTQLAADFPDITASVGPGNTLRISSAIPELKFSFANDSSGALGALGVNTFFTGHDSTDIDVNGLVSGNPGYIAAATSGMPGDNSNVTLLLDFQREPLEGLGGASVEGFYQSIVSTLGVQAAGAQDAYLGSQAITSAVRSQREAVSGVSLDEEAVKLIRYQSGYAAAARYISTVDRLLSVLLNM